MFNTRFGIEVEFSGITRETAAKTAAGFLGGSVSASGRSYHVECPDHRVWKFVFDNSIAPKRKENGNIFTADDEYKVEMVSPILTYNEDIETLQELVRRLRRAGGFVGAASACGIHIHLDGAEHTPRSVRNFINIIASRNDLLYKALQIEPERMRYCKKLDEYLVERVNRKKPKTLDELAAIWYSGYSGNRDMHYHESRYNFLNLHPLFSGNGTLELRCFNSADENGNLHAGKIRSYIVLALALNHQALTQKSASPSKPQMENERFALRVYLNRIGFIGKEFKNCREHLCAHLSGNSAWRYRAAGQN